MILVQEVSLVAQICRISSFPQSTKFQVYRHTPEPFRIVDRSGKIYKSSKLQPRFCIYILFLIVTYIQCYMRRKVMLLGEVVLIWLTMLGHAVFACNIYVNERKPEEITLYINYLYKIESIYGKLFRTSSKNVASFKLKMTLWLTKCACVTTIVFPIAFVYGLHWNNPCKATMVGFSFITKCRCVVGIDQTHFQVAKNTSLEVLVFLVNHWFWSFGLQGAIFGVLLIATMTMLSIDEIIGGFVANMLIYAP